MLGGDDRDRVAGGWRTRRIRTPVVPGARTF
jgi:hypothetical protein